MALAVGLIPAFLIMAFVMTRKALRAKKTKDSLLRSLASKATERLSDQNLGAEAVNTEVDAIEAALVRKDEHALRAFSNLIGQQPAFDITMTVFMVEFMRMDSVPLEVVITPDSLTAEQVRVFTEVTNAIDDGINFESILDNNANRVAYYAMENLSDSALILSIINSRGIKELDQIKEVLAEMKLGQSGALAEGSL